MIIPIRCMSCGKEIANKWRRYQAEVKKLKGDETSYQRVYFDGTGPVEETPEKKVMDALGLKRPCCRKHFLTQVDLIDKI